MWQSWLEHWEAWKEVYVPLSWVHKYRRHCTAEYVQWHDSFIEDYPWIIPLMTDELGSGETDAARTEDHKIEESSPEDLNVSEVTCGGTDTDKRTNFDAENGNETLPESTEQYDTETESHVGVYDVKKDSSEQTLEQENAEKEHLDGLYKEHSKKRYWVHLRSFLHDSGVQSSDDIETFFAQQCGLSFNKTHINTKEADLELNCETEPESVHNDPEEPGLMDSAAAVVTNGEHREVTSETVVHKSPSDLENPSEFLDEEVQSTSSQILELEEHNSEVTNEQCQKANLGMDNEKSSSGLQLLHMDDEIPDMGCHRSDHSDIHTSSQALVTEEAVECKQEDNSSVSGSAVDDNKEPPDESEIEKQAERTLDHADDPKLLPNSSISEEEHNGMKSHQNTTASSSNADTGKKKKKSKGTRWVLAGTLVDPLIIQPKFK